VGCGILDLEKQRRGLEFDGYKIETSRQRCRRLLLLAVVFLAVAWAPAAIAVEYAYQGLSYDTVNDNTNIPGTFTTVMAVSGTVLLSSAPPAYSQNPFSQGDLVSASFSNGRHSFDEDDIDPTRSWIRVNSLGHVTAWSLYFSRGEMLAPGDETVGIGSSHNSSSFQEYGSVVSCAASDCASFYTENAFAASAGAWTVDGVPSPPPPSPNVFYEYQGELFDPSNDNANVPGAFTTDMSVNGTLAFEEPLAPDLPTTFLVDILASASFSNGRGVFTLEDLEPTQSWIRTDENGDISAWGLKFQTTPMVEIGDQRHVMYSYRSSSFQEYGSVLACAAAGCGSFYTEPAFAPAPGSWTSPTPPPPPVPVIGPLGAVALIASLVAVARRRA